MDPEQENLAEPTFDDAALFNSALSEEAPEQPEPELAQPEQEQPKADAEQPRNPDGTFATKEKPVEASEEKPVATEPPAEDDKTGQIPSWRLREVSEERRRLETELQTERAARAREAAEFSRRLAVLEKPASDKPAEEPDPLLNPIGFRDHITNSFAERLRNQEREFDLRLAKVVHGDKFDAAYKAAQQAIANGDTELPVRMQRAASPGEALMKWHQERQIVQEVGSDPAAYRQKILDEALGDPAFLAKATDAARAKAGQPANTRPAVSLPPSLSSAARADQATSPDDTDMSDEALFKYATR